MINIRNSAGFSHHRCGWNFCTKILEEFHNDHGILCMTYADGIIGHGEEVNEPWIGFFHNTPTHPEYCRYVYPVHDSMNGANTPLSKLKILKNFHDSIKSCKGIFTLSEYTANYLKEEVQVKVPINVLMHPVDDVELKFDFDQFLNNQSKTVYTIGHWMRNFQSTYDVDCPYPKVIIDVANVVELIPLNKNSSVEVIEKVSIPDYDFLMSRNIVFIDLFDVAACNGVIDCLIRNTPLIIKRMPANEEYLGKDYPLFFNNIKDASKLFDINKIELGYKYLVSLDKSKFTKEKFRNDFFNSSIIQKIKRRFYVI